MVKKTRKVKGGWGFPMDISSGVKYKESRESKRQRVMKERAEKAERKSEISEQKRQSKLDKIRKQTEVLSAIASKRAAERKARSGSNFKVPKIRSRKRRISMF